MIRRRLRFGLLALMALPAVLSLLASPPSMAAEMRDYAYMLVQGKLSGDDMGIAGLEVTLRGEGASFSSTTGERGTFSFERVPVARYELSVRTADGKTARRMLELPTVDSGRARARLRLGQGPAAAIVIEPRNDGEVRLQVPRPATRWGKLGKQALIFVGAAALLAL